MEQKRPGGTETGADEKGSKGLELKAPAQVINKPPMWGKTRLWIIIQFLRRYRRLPGSPAQNHHL